MPINVKLPDGSVWRNRVTEGKSKVAETLDEFRANYRYNFLDLHVRAFQAAIRSSKKTWAFMGNAILNVKNVQGDSVFLWHNKDMAAFPARYAQCLFNICSNFQESYAPIKPVPLKKRSVFLAVFLFQKRLQHEP